MYKSAARDGHSGLAIICEGIAYGFEKAQSKEIPGERRGGGRRGSWSGTVCERADVNTRRGRAREEKYQGADSPSGVTT